MPVDPPASPAPAPSEAIAPAKMPFPRRARRIALRIARSAILMYVLVCVIMFFVQRYLIFPGSLRHGTADTLVQPDAGSELVHLKNPAGIPLTGLFSKRDARAGDPAAARWPTVIYFYGNGESMNDALGQSDMFRQMGANCMLVDYAGFGMSDGSACERGCYDAAEAAYQYVLTRPEADSHRIIAAGWSLGAAVAIDLAWRHQGDHGIAGLMTFSGFTSMVEMGKRNYPFLPVSLMLRDRFMSIEKIREIRIPYFLGHGRIDPAIPYADSDALADSFGGGPALLTRFTAPTAGHNDFFESGGAALHDAIPKFLAPYTARPATNDFPG